MKEVKYILLKVREKKDAYEPLEYHEMDLKTYEKIKIGLKQKYDNDLVTKIEELGRMMEDGG